jgi:hypothetical protein
MSTLPLLGLSPFQWLALIVAGTALLLAMDAGVGHYRHSFAYRLQFTPLLVGPLLAGTCLLTAVFPEVEGVRQALAVGAWLAVFTGLIGFGYHLYYGIVRKPGGLKWLLHYLMYGAPLLLPLALSAMGWLALIVGAGLAGSSTVFGVSIPSMLIIFVVLVLTGSILQAAILHYRGAFNTPAMYLPFSVPIVTVLAGVWITLAPSAWARSLFAALLWLTLLVGFVGFGMHLRGLDRQMGGLYVALFNLMQGPPQGAPGLFVALAGVGLIAVYLM